MCRDMRKYTIVDYFGYNLTPTDRMKAIKAAGFDGVVVLWADYFDDDYDRFPSYAEKAGLFVENLHMPYRGANSLWYDNARGQAYTESLYKGIEDCAYHGIPTVVIHPTSKGIIPLPDVPLGQTNIGIERMKRIAGLAERFEVNVAIENMQSPEYIGYILENVKSDRLGFCYDSGHHSCFTPDADLLTKYGHRLAALHIHDNDGTSDAHTLPFEGSINWADIGAKIRACGYDGPCSLEAQNGGFEHITDPVEFLTIALERAKKVL